MLSDHRRWPLEFGHFKKCGRSPKEGGSSNPPSTQKQKTLTANLIPLAMHNVSALWSAQANALVKPFHQAGRKTICVNLRLLLKDNNCQNERAEQGLKVEKECCGEKVDAASCRVLFFLFFRPAKIIRLWFKRSNYAARCRVYLASSSPFEWSLLKFRTGVLPLTHWKKRFYHLICIP